MVELIMGIISGLIKLAPDIRIAIAGILNKKDPTPADLAQLRVIVDREYSYYDPDPPAA